MSGMVTTRITGLPDTADDPAGQPSRLRTGKLMRLPAAPEQRILVVEFRSPHGRSWNAIGGGPTVAAAIIYARESCPDDAFWDAVSWSDLYGE
jgi:hypothetical protein